MRRYRERGQVTAEQAVLFAFVIGGFVAMGFYLQRGVQGSTKSNADAVGGQFSTESGYYAYVASDTHETNDGTTTSTSCSDTIHSMGDPTVPVPAVGRCGDRVLEDAEDPAVLTADGDLPDTDAF